MKTTFCEPFNVLITSLKKCCFGSSFVGGIEIMENQMSMQVENSQ